MSARPLVLLVDDEKAILEELGWHLEQRGWRVVLASDGSQGESLWKTHNHELRLVVTDIRMPGTHGKTLVKSISSSRQHLRPALFIMTAFDDVSREDAHRMGADALFQKPFRVKELVAAAEHFMKVADSNDAESSALHVGQSKATRH
ncbi:response regulator [bacterium]|nr:response regulator [bacterium]